MQRIALVSDSSCDLSRKTVEKYGVRIVPTRIIYKDREYLDQITISSDEMYASLATEVPTTSLPDVGYCHKVFDEIKSEGYTDVIVATVSGKLSGTLNSLRVISNDYEGINFHFYDTKTLGYPQGAIVMEIAKMIEQGMKCEDILENLESVRQRVTGYVALNTLEYLMKGGRIGKVAGTIGEMIHLKPIISSNDEGVLYKYARSRGRVQSISKLKSILQEHLEKARCHVWVLSGDAFEEAKKLYEEFKNDPRITEISLETIGPAMGIHTGPKSIGLCILEEF
ncbi:MAG: DegV family protein [Clostridium sp.]|uniref:DegV family protein n=1 Tax=Clostridium sp. TaxID=1506 RepID=UPI0030346998